MEFNYHPAHVHERDSDDPEFRWAIDTKGLSEEEMHFLMAFEAYVERFCTLDQQRDMTDMTLEQAVAYVANLAKHDPDFDIRQSIQDFDGSALGEAKREDRHAA